jgi:hypothetical protein
MRNYEILATAGTACRRTVADALSVLESQAPSETTTPPKSATADDAARTMACTLPAQRYTEVSQRSVTQGHLSEIGRCEVKSASITDSGQHRASIHHVRWVQ